MAEDTAIDEAYIFEVHEKSFTAASDRVRHLMVTSIVASILVFAAYRNAHSEKWLESRVRTARVASRNAVWEKGIEQRIALCYAQSKEKAGFKDTCDEVKNASTWYSVSRHDSDSFKKALESFEQARVMEMLIVDVPFLGIQFDINDLGAFSAIGLAVIAIVLCYSMVRYHENLYLCLWKIRRVAEREGRFNDSQSKANFLYHSLAMAQVFSRAPTLARWKNRVALGRLPSLLLLAVPCLAQVPVFLHDRRTMEAGNIFSKELTKETMYWIEMPALAILLGSTILSFIYAVAADKRWAATFFAINPSLIHLKPSDFTSWLFPRFYPRFRIEGNRLLLVNKNSGKVWQIEEQESKKKQKLVMTHDFPTNIFDSFRFKDGWVYKLKQHESDKVEALRGRTPEAIAGKKISIGDAVPGNLPEEFDLYLAHNSEDRIMKIGSGESAESEIGSVPCERRFGGCFMDLASNGKNVYAIEAGRKKLWKVSCESKKASQVATGSWIWLPVAVACFKGHLFVAEVPRGGLRLIIRQPARVRVFETTTNAPSKLRAASNPENRELSGGGAAEVPGT